MALEEHGFNDFTDREKVSFLIDGIMTSTLEAPITAINMNLAHSENFELAQFQLAKCIKMATERSRHTNLNVSATYTSCDNRGGRGGCGGRGGGGRGGGGCGGAAKLPNGNEDIRGIGRGDFDFDANKLSHINKNYYHPAEYANLSPPEKRKLYLTQQAQKSEPGWTGKLVIPNVVTVSVAPTEVSALTLYVASLQRANKIR